MKEVLLTLWHFLQIVGTVSVIFAIFTFIIHIQQSKLLGAWRKESEEAHKAQAEANAEAHKAQIEALASIEEGNRYIAGVAERVEATTERVAEIARYIADLVVKEGQLTREAVKR